MIKLKFWSLRNCGVVQRGTCSVLVSLEAHVPSTLMAWRHLFLAYNQRGIRSVRADQAAKLAKMNEN